jgi:transposase
MSSERIVKDIRRATRKQYSAEEKIRIVLDGLRGEHSIAELCRREGIAESLYYTWSKEFLEAGKRRLAGDTARAATSGEVKDLRREARALKVVVAEQALELRLLKKSMTSGRTCRRSSAAARRHQLRCGEDATAGQIGEPAGPARSDILPLPAGRHGRDNRSARLSRTHCQLRLHPGDSRSPGMTMLHETRR